MILFPWIPWIPMEPPIAPQKPEAIPKVTKVERSSSLKGPKDKAKVLSYQPKGKKQKEGSLQYSSMGDTLEISSEGKSLYEKSNPHM